MKLLKIISKQFCQGIKNKRIQIVPQPFSVTPLQQYFHVTSKNYDFLLKSNPNCSQIYQHYSDTPSSLLKRNAIHIFPDSMPQQNINQKYKALIRKLQNDYQKAFKACKKPSQVFHLQRRIKTDIRNRTQYIGKITGKYKHYNLFKSINQINKQKTMQQYKKNGVSVSAIGKNKIYPQGPVWLPTTDTYLKLVEKFLSETTLAPKDILDLGCGSGILSFILGKKYKKSKICSVDINKHAVQTCLVNAASLGIQNIQAIEVDVTNTQEFQFKMKQKKQADKFDLIISNPPWIVAKKGQHQSQILDGVYDHKAKFLKSVFKISKKRLNDKNSRLLLIYSDLSHHLGLSDISIEQLCNQNSLLIHSKQQSEYPKAVQKQSPLSPYKLKSKIYLYQIGSS